MCKKDIIVAKQSENIILYPTKQAGNKLRPATTQKRPVKIPMYLGLDIIIKLKSTTIFDRCAILNVLSYLTKNFES